MIHWGVWGAGRVAQDVCRDLALVPGTCLHAVAARRSERAKALAERFGAPHAHDCLAALLSDAKVDVVYVATPTDCHLGDALACINAGKAVLCEKPLALNLSQANELVSVARVKNVFCMEAMWSRFVPAVVKARQLVKSGRLGRIRMLEGSFGYRVKESPASRLFQLHSGGGALLDRGVYLLSLAQYFLGTPETIHGGCLRANSGVDLQSSFLLRYAGEIQASLTASLCTQLPNELVISGEAGTLTLHDPFYRASHYTFRSVHITHLESSSKMPTGLKARLKSYPQVQLWYRKARFWRSMVRRARSASMPFAGSGYQFELAEVTQCLREGLIESRVMPLDDTLEVARQMDELRAQWGVATRRDA